MLFTNCTKPGTALIETTLMGESLYLVCNFRGCGSANILVTVVYRGVTNLLNFEMSWGKLLDRGVRTVLNSFFLLCNQVAQLSIFPWCSLKILASKKDSHLPSISANFTTFRLLKGQLISKCVSSVIVWTKISTKQLTNSALEFEMGSNHKIKALYNVFNSLDSLHYHM